MRSKSKLFPLLIAVLAGGACSAVVITTDAFAQLANTASDIHWVRYTDNAEGAFSIDVPTGWQVTGGMYRFGYFDVRWMMNVRSLDGKVLIRIDDPDVPPYVLPGPHSGPAGHPATKQGMFQMVVSNYEEAQPYAENYAKQRFSQVCKSMTSRASDWTPTLPQSWIVPASQKQSAASIAYDCSTSDGPRIVDTYARSSILGNQGLWMVDPIITILATPRTMHLAQTMTQHMIDSWQESPQWKQYQAQMTQAGLEQIRMQFGQFMQQMQIYHQQREAAMNQQVSQYYARQNVQAQQVSGFCEDLTGLTTLRDSVTGTEFQVFSGPKANYYRNGQGVTVNSNLSPGPGFYQVPEVRH